MSWMIIKSYILSKGAREMAKKIEKNVLEAPKKLALLFTIVDRRKGDFYFDVLEGFDVNFQTVLYGVGTATSEIQSLLGLTNSDKAIILSIIKEENVKDVLALYEDKYFKLKNGKGIAFSVAMDSMIGKLAYEFLSNIGGNING